MYATHDPPWSWEVKVLCGPPEGKSGGDRAKASSLIVGIRRSALSGEEKLHKRKTRKRLSEETFELEPAETRKVHARLEEPS